MLSTDSATTAVKKLSAPQLKTPLKALVCALLASGALGSLHAQTMQAAASKAVRTNPEAQQKWHEFRASIHERSITWGRNLPTLDVIYGLGDERRDSPLYNPTGERHYTFHTQKATLRQNLFEGFATLNDTRRLDHASMVRFYETLDVSENVALEAVKAYIDVWRFRQLVEFATESYATHRMLYEKIKQRAMAGAGRKADLESAGGRLALSESNLLTETANLHDVTARYQRVIGDLPPADLPAPPTELLNKAMPKDRAEGINRSFEKSPALKAAFENILSAGRNIDVQKAGYMPRVDAYIERGSDRDMQGYAGISHVTTYGLTASWNLFNGVRDVSKERKAAEEKYTAVDLREKVCRSVRQNSAMAYNDFLRLGEQLALLDQHQLSTDKAREAFRRQFDIGQRTLLDVLDTENEYFTARRNYMNGLADHDIAKARFLASAGVLGETLNLQRLDMTAPLPEPGSEEEALGRCPVEPPQAYERARPKEQFILLPEAGGKIGTLVINPGDNELTLNSPYAAAEANNKAATVRASSDEEVQKRYKHLMLDAAAPVLQSYTVRFAIGKADIPTGAQKTLKAVVDDYRKQPSHQLITIGHADKIGTTAINEKLSEARSKAVRDYLVKAGIPADSITARWAGDREPLPETQGKAKDERNRRVEIRLQ